MDGNELADHAFREAFVLPDADNALVYLSADGMRVETFTGSFLAHVTDRRIRHGRTPSGGTYKRHYIRAVDEQNRHWHGSSPGPGMYLRLHRSKQ